MISPSKIAVSTRLRRGFKGHLPSALQERSEQSDELVDVGGLADCRVGAEHPRIAQKVHLVDPTPTGHRNDLHIGVCAPYRCDGLYSILLRHQDVGQDYR